MPQNSSFEPSESIRRLRIHPENEMDYPDRPGEPDCIYFLRTGECGYGDKCRFNHPTYNGQHGDDLPERVGEPDCVHFLKTGTCKYGSTCKSNHPRDRHGGGLVRLNMIGLPIRQGQKSCAHYVRTGSCKFGVTCKFHHPEPAPEGSNTLISGPLTHTPSDAPPRVNGSAWPYPSPQTYWQLVLPPSSTTQGWNPYMGNMKPVLSTNGLGSMDHLYPSMPSSHLPQRPGVPECRYFVNNGSCKYGSDCKYHHPMALPVASSLSPLGLPLRPGEAMCLYYMVHGMCKYGVGCKYDHPLVTYLYNYTMGMPSLPIIYPSFFPYGGMNSSESPSWKTSNGIGNWNGSNELGNGNEKPLCSNDEHVGSSM